MTNSTILLQAAAQPQQSMWSTLLMFGGIILIFYFFMIRPQQKKAKKIREEREKMAKGDNVVTAGGIYGKIREVGDTWFMIQVDQNVKIRVDKNSVYPSAADAAADLNNQNQNQK